MVVAFRGTVDVFDALTDLSCRPTQLQCVSADDAIMLHSGIYLGVLSCCARIDAAYCKLASDYSAAQKPPPPLFVTGSFVSMIHCKNTLPTPHHEDSSLLARAFTWWWLRSMCAAAPSVAASNTWACGVARGMLHIWLTFGSVSLSITE